MYDESVLDEIATLGEAIAAANATRDGALSGEQVDEALGLKRRVPPQQRQGG